MSRELRIFPGVGSRKCGAFLPSLDRDPHPTCARCRGKICARDLTCDFCVGWSPAQWELFAKKRTHKERKKFCPTGCVSLAPGASPRTGTSSEVPQPGTSSSSSRPSEGQDKRRGSLGVHLVLYPVRLPLLPLDLGLARGGGGEMSLDIRLLRVSASLSLQLLRELQRGRLLGRSGLPLPVPLPRLLLLAHRSTLRDVMSREKFRWTDDLLPPLTVHGQRREDGEPDVSSRRVWRRLLSPRLLLSLKRLL